MSELPAKDERQVSQAGVDTPGLALTRERMLATALELVKENGPKVVLAGITLDQVVAKSGVSRSSAYRIWSTKESFLQSVAESLIQPAFDEMLPMGQAMMQTARMVIAELIGQLGTAEQRAEVLNEVVSAVFVPAASSYPVSSVWRNLLALAALSSSCSAEERTAMRAEMSAREEEFVSGMASLYEELGLILGYRPVEGSSYRLLATALRLIGEGWAFRTAIADASPTDELAAAEAHPSVAAARGIVASMLEPVPDYRFEEVLPVYLARMASGE